MSRVSSLIRMLFARMMLRKRKMLTTPPHLKHLKDPKKVQPSLDKSNSYEAPMLEETVPLFS
jgi:hypothetical protein